MDSNLSTVLFGFLLGRLLFTRELLGKAPLEEQMTDSMEERCCCGAFCWGRGRGTRPLRTSMRLHNWIPEAQKFCDGTSVPPWIVGPKFSVASITPADPCETKVLGFVGENRSSHGMADVHCLLSFCAHLPLFNELRLFAR